MGLTVLRMHRQEEEEANKRSDYYVMKSYICFIFYLTFSKLFELDISSLFFHFLSLSFSLFFSVPFQVSVHSGRLCVEGEPGAADAQFWVLLAGVILSHTGPLINGPLSGPH